MYDHGAGARAPGECCFKWGDYPADVANMFLEVLRAQCMVDVTVCAEGRHLHAHRIVLSACSAYLQEILSCTDDAHPVLILSGISFDDVQSVIEFMYQGEISVGADRIKSVLNTAEELQIRGLMGVSSHFVEEEGATLPEESPPEHVEASNEAEVADREPGTSEVIEPRSSDEMGQDEDEAKGTVNLTKYDDKKRRCRRKSCRKDYSEEALAAALEELRAGRSLVSTAGEHGIPRSTLYVRARSQGIQLAVCRRGHRGDRVQAAIKAVTDGASLQRAAEQYQIPKTVLWRNVRKQLGARPPPAGPAGLRRKTYDEEKRRAAVRALEQGDNLTRVSHQYQIPKTTLFREKTRLVETGRLPWSCLKRRGPYLDCFKRSRLGEAVAACQDGRMSQAAASVTFQVPKTTIWRRLQERGGGSGHPGRRGGTLKVEAVDEDEPAPVQQFAFSQVGGHIPVTYVQGSEFGEASLIILDPGRIAVEGSGRVAAEPPSETEETEEPETVDSENIEIVGSDNITDENESMANEDVT
ncbi:uncharacterized protein LOC134538153 isoform X2 [Bacillus rossius redtenbacheri]